MGIVFFVDDPEITSSRKKNSQEAKKYRENMNTVITWSNATPFKTHGTNFACCFCKEEFPSSKQLKEHTHLHPKETVLNSIKRVYDFNVKFDITDLKCRVCHKSIDSLEQLIVDLKNHKKVYHTDVKNLIIPYKFDSDEIKCSICGEVFKYFKLLSDHMSKHYPNFECDLCGKAFVQKHLLTKHKNRHLKGEFKCNICRKVYGTKERRDDHVRVVHVYASRAHKCWKCGLCFADADQKAEHNVEAHGAEPLIFTCNFCENTFTTRRATRFHINTCHIKRTPHKCSDCDRTYPTKSLLARHAKRHETPKEIEKVVNQERHYSFVQELKKVLYYTSAVPFKIKAAQYYCAYCYTTFDSFDNPYELRVHNQNHLKDRVDRLDQIMRPQFLNEILRVDIELLQCSVCNVSIPTWNDMFLHLNDKHDVQFDQAYTKLIPYRLQGSLVSCALCNEEFSGFQFLDTHMNAHYANYMCSDCGDTFVTENRLKHHAMIHNTGRYPCSHCGKVFSLEKYKKKHEGMVHKESKMFKCIDCSEAFHTEYERHMHVLAQHKERIRTSTCEFCGKTFDWKPYYLAHMRKVHSKVKKYVCRYCKKGFSTKHEMSMHELRHTGKGKHACVVCDRNYVTLTELKKHFKKHVKEIRYIDEADLQNGTFGDVILLDESKTAVKDQITTQSPST